MSLFNDERINQLEQRIAHLERKLNMETDKGQYELYGVSERRCDILFKEESSNNETK